MNICEVPSGHGGRRLGAQLSPARGLWHVGTAPTEPWGAQPARCRQICPGPRWIPSPSSNNTQSLLVGDSGGEAAWAWQILAINNLKNKLFMKKYISCRLLS